MKPQSSIVFVVDDDASVRMSLANLLRSVGLRVECFKSSQEFLRRRSSEGPSCLVLDVRMPGSSGIELQRELDLAQRQIPIIFVTGHGDIPMAVEAMKAGAVEFLTKPFREEDLLAAVRSALDRDRSSKAHRAALAAIRGRHARLTARQRQITSQIVQGKLNKQIAAELALSENTIKVHRRRIMEKMGASNVAELVQMIERLA